MNKDFSKDILKKIKKNNIKPISKKIFYIRTFILYMLIILSILIWAVSFSVILWYLFAIDFFIANKVWFFILIKTFLPIFWIFFVLIICILVYYEFRKTQRWYKFYLYQIIFWNILITFLFWIIFYFSWFSKTFESTIQDNFPKYRQYLVLDKTSRMIKVWQNEDVWLLIWKIYSINNNSNINNIEFIDYNNKIWFLEFNNNSVIKHNLELKEWLEIKLIWEKLSDNIFEVKEVRPFNKKLID